MSRAQALRSIEEGIALAHDLFGEGCDMVAAGEMGIATTTAASALNRARGARLPLPLRDSAGLGPASAIVRRESECWRTLFLFDGGV